LTFNFAGIEELSHFNWIISTRH